MTYVLVLSYVVLTAVGAYLLIFRRSYTSGGILVAAGLVVISVHYIRELLHRRQELESQRSWISEVQSIADDLSLSGYGIPTLDDLASYHDAQGRQAVLDALKGLPLGRRRLLEAARQVEPDAVWD